MYADRLLASLVVVLIATADAGAQTPQLRKQQNEFVVATPPTAVKVLEAAPLEAVTVVRGAPFSAEAVTEFAQVLGDGNRIERRYFSSIARDSRGRTRREEEIALLGPLGTTGPAPRLVTIADPDLGVTYTLDETARVAHRNAGMAGKLVEVPQLLDIGGVVMTMRGSGSRGPKAAGRPDALAADNALLRSAAGGGTVLVESLGTRTIEGVSAEGTRTTSTIPAGAVGNLLPIEVTSERWFSNELQMAVLITRRDPRAGETVYRLTNIVRGEQPDALFAVPPDYEVRDGGLGAAFGKLEVIRRK
jgi:hypothetical protein